MHVPVPVAVAASLDDGTTTNSNVNDNSNPTIGGTNTIATPTNPTSTVTVISAASPATHAQSQSHSPTLAASTSMPASMSITTPNATPSITRTTSRTTPTPVPPPLSSSTPSVPQPPTTNTATPTRKTTRLAAAAASAAIRSSSSSASTPAHNHSTATPSRSTPRRAGARASRIVESESESEEEEEDDEGDDRGQQKGERQDSKTLLSGISSTVVVEAADEQDEEQRGRDGGDEENDDDADADADADAEADVEVDSGVDHETDRPSKNNASDKPPSTQSGQGRGGQQSADDEQERQKGQRGDEAEAGEEDGVAAHENEYSTGRVTCEGCGLSVSFREDEENPDSSKFTLRHWQEHQRVCPAATRKPPSAAQGHRDRHGPHPYSPRGSGHHNRPFDPPQPISPGTTLTSGRRSRALSSAAHTHAHHQGAAAPLGQRGDAERFGRDSDRVRERDRERERDEMRFAQRHHPHPSDGRAHDRQADKERERDREQVMHSLQPPPPPPAASGSGAASSKDGPGAPPWKTLGAPISLTFSSAPSAQGREQGHGQGQGQFRSQLSMMHVPLSASHASHTSSFSSATNLGVASFASASSTLGSSAGGTAHPKRRRQKRTEEERIAYLRHDPYVAQFEAYRVLCRSCGKWIRLRPNSTYCSIPWDAHRKSCLAKKVNASTKNTLALEDRNHLFRTDPHVRKWDPERILCDLCDRWLAVPPEDHAAAVDLWLAHRGRCEAGIVVAGGAGPSQQHQGQSPSQSHRAPASGPSVPSSAVRGDVGEDEDGDGESEDADADADADAEPEDADEPRRTNVEGAGTATPATATAKSPVSAPGSAPKHQQQPLSPSSATGRSGPGGPGIPLDRQHQQQHPRVFAQSQSQQHASSSRPPVHGATHADAQPHSPHAHNGPGPRDRPEHSQDHSDDRGERQGHFPTFNLTPTTYAPAHESRRRNAEQRAATLRADPLIGVVEENRVFCSLCEKWVQLRQDSSFCAYPWLQHRGKCLARSQRREQKLAEAADLKARKLGHVQGHQHLHHQPPNPNGHAYAASVSSSSSAHGGHHGHHSHHYAQDHHRHEHQQRALQHGGQAYRHVNGGHAPAMTGMYGHSHPHARRLQAQDHGHHPYASSGRRRSRSFSPSRRDTSRVYGHDRPPNSAGSPYFVEGSPSPTPGSRSVSAHGMPPIYVSDSDVEEDGRADLMPHVERPPSREADGDDPSERRSTGKRSRGLEDEHRADADDQRAGKDDREAQSDIAAADVVVKQEDDAGVPPPRKRQKQQLLSVQTKDGEYNLQKPLMSPSLHSLGHRGPHHRDGEIVHSPNDRDGNAHHQHRVPHALGEKQRSLHEDIPHGPPYPHPHHEQHQPHQTRSPYVYEHKGHTSPSGRPGYSRNNSNVTRNGSSVAQPSRQDYARRTVSSPTHARRQGGMPSYVDPTYSRVHPDGGADVDADVDGDRPRAVNGSGRAHGHGHGHGDNEFMDIDDRVMLGRPAPFSSGPVLSSASQGVSRPKGSTRTGSGPISMSRGVPQRPRPVGIADLDSAYGRRAFIALSIEHLFSTTFERTDDMTVSALLTYLNAAMPADKHEDFDTTEVARALAALKEKGRIAFEGDVLRLI